jgi:hypothetical protein
VSSEKSPPAVPLALGLAGLVPFLALAPMAAGWIGPILVASAESARLMLAVYGVAILAFLGGVRWGLAMTYDSQEASRRDYLLSVLPAIAAWAAFALAAPWDLRTIALMHLAWGLMDYGLACRTVAPEWYGRLRLALSAVAAILLWIGA